MAPAGKKLVNGVKFHYKGIRSLLTVQMMKKEAAVPESEPPEKKAEAWWEFCPLCGSKLVNRKCRFVCSDPKCHYFMSCSEFDL